MCPMNVTRAAGGEGLRGSRARLEVALVTQGHGGRDAGEDDSGKIRRLRESGPGYLGGR